MHASNVSAIVRTPGVVGTASTIPGMDTPNVVGTASAYVSGLCMRIDACVVAAASAAIGEADTVAGGAVAGAISLKAVGVSPDGERVGRRWLLQALIIPAAAGIDSASRGIFFNSCRRDTGSFIPAKCKQSPRLGGGKSGEQA